MQAVDMMNYGHLTVTETIKWQIAGISETWTVKNIVTNLASFEQAVVDLLRSTTTRNTTFYFEQLINRDGKFNDEEVAKPSQSTFKQIIEKYESAYVEAVDVLSHFTSDWNSQVANLALYTQQIYTNLRIFAWTHSIGITISTAYEPLFALGDINYL